MTNKLLMIGLAAISLAACDSHGPYQGVQCKNIANGYVLDNVDQPLSDVNYGFDGTDKDGYQHQIPKRDAPYWKCRNVTYHE